MNSKFFGNSLDLFKYDLLTFLAKTERLNLFYLAMLTKPEPKKLDPKYKLFEVGFKNEILFKKYCGWYYTWCAQLFLYLFSYSFAAQQCNAKCCGYPR